MTEIEDRAIKESALRGWNLSNGRELRFLGLTGRPGAIAVSPDGRTVAVGGATGDISLWEVASGKVRMHMRGHRGNVFSLAFSPDGRLLASGSLDRTALIWDLAETGGDLRPHREIPQTEIARLWEDLACSDAARAGVAVRRLTADPDRAVSFLSRRLRPVARPDAERIDRFIADLNADKFETRESGQLELEALGEMAIPAVREALSRNPTTEAQRRLTAVLERVDQGILAGAELQNLRALEILEHAGGSEARKVLEHLADGAPGARCTQDARAALERLGGGGRR
jgi:hypothetical protein